MGGQLTRRTSFKYLRVPTAIFVFLNPRFLREEWSDQGDKIVTLNDWLIPYGDWTADGNGISNNAGRAMTSALIAVLERPLTPAKYGELADVLPEFEWC